MFRARVAVALFLSIPLIVLCTTLASASRAGSPVPPLIRFTGTVPGAAGETVDLVFVLYQDSASEAPLWKETQTVTVDADGRYTVALGAAAPDGLPAELFADGAARWLGVRVGNGPEWPRVLLVSVPYALKAADAETVGGKPVSAFVLAGDKTGVGDDGITYVNARALAAGLATPAGGAASSASGTPNYLALFTDASNLGNSIVFQSGAGRLGVNTALPQAPFHFAAPETPGSFFDVYSGSASNVLGALPVVHRAARGTVAVPLAVQTDDILGGLAVRAYTGEAFTGGRGQVMFKAAEPWSETANGTYLQFTTTSLGTTSYQERMRVSSAGNVGIGTTAPAQKLSVAGTIESTSGGIKFPDGTTQGTSAASYAAGAGLQLAGTQFSALFAGTGALDTIARSDHHHDASYVSLAGSYTNPTWLTSLAMSKITGNLPVARVTGAASLAANTFGDTQTIASGFLVLPATDSAGKSGILFLGSQPFLHSGATTTVANTFVGSQAGNYGTSGSGSNVGVGTQALAAVTSGHSNTAVGALSLQSNTGNANTAVGASALRSVTANDNSAFGFQALMSNTAAGNTAFGSSALSDNTTATGNSAFGYWALKANSTGTNNTAFGSSALAASTTASSNSAFGYGTLRNNTTGAQNTAIGKGALTSNSTALNNSAVGFNALYGNDIGAYNSALGAGALMGNTEGNENNAFGGLALRYNTTGSGNVGIGYSSLFNSTSGSDNTSIGGSALFSLQTGGANTSVGASSGGNLTTGSNNTFLGAEAGTTGATPNLHHATAIGAGATVSADNSMALGGVNGSGLEVSVGIGTATPNTKLQVVGNVRVGTSGTNGCVQRYDGVGISGTCASDSRFKTDIRSIEGALQRLTQLRPVQYRWRADAFPQRHFGNSLVTGLLAQEVEQVFPELVSTDDDGYKLLSSTELPYLTIAAVKELKAENDALKAQLATALARKDAEVRELTEQLARLAERLASIEKK